MFMYTIYRNVGYVSAPDTFPEPLDVQPGEGFDTISAMAWAELVYKDAFSVKDSAIYATNNFGRGFGRHQPKGDVWDVIEWVSPACMRKLDEFGVGRDWEVGKAGLSILGDKRIGATWWSHWNLPFTRAVKEHSLKRRELSDMVPKPRSPGVRAVEAAQDITANQLVVGLLFAVLIHERGNKKKRA